MVGHSNTKQTKKDYHFIYLKMLVKLSPNRVIQGFPLSLDLIHVKRIPKCIILS